MKRGSKIISIDPVYNWVGSRAEEWLQIRPGTDGALVLGMLNVIINENLYDKEFVGEGIILDLREIKHGKVLGLDDLESALGGREIKDGDKVLLHTGWEDHWGSDDYINSHSGLGKDAAKFLVKKGVDLVGIDTPNLDHPDASDFPAHHTLLGSQVLIVENLCNLGSIGGKRFTFIALPLKIKEGTGSPIRAIALL